MLVAVSIALPCLEGGGWGGGGTYIKCQNTFHFLFLSLLYCRRSCILGEMPTRRAMFRGESELTQLDLIFQATGSPSAEVQVELRKLPDWDKLGFDKTYLNRMSAKFPHVTDKTFFGLLDRLLDVNPRTRISAREALVDPYFTAHRVVPPSEYVSSSRSVLIVSVAY